MASKGISVEEGDIKLASAVEHLKEQFATIRGGRVVTGLIEDVQVEAYNAQMPLKQIATLNVSDTFTILVRVWDANLTKNAEKALRMDDRGFSLRVDGTNIFVKTQPLSEERRHEYVKIAKDTSEDCRQLIRRIRNEIMERVAEMKELKEIGEDDERRLKDDIEKTIKSANDQVEALLAEKEKDLMAVGG